jgi:hypothetical protein
MRQETPEERAARQARFEQQEKASRLLAIDQAKLRLAQQMGLRYAKCSLETFAVKFKEQMAALESVKKFLAEVADHVTDGRGLVLYGSVGTGKDHLLAACLFAAIDAGFVAVWKNAQSVYEAARDQMDGNGRETDLIREFTSPQVLGLSDPTPPSGDLSGFRVELLWRIADVRYRNLKPIWVTMNATSTEECQEKLSVPLWDRLQDNAVCVPCFWPSFRVKS